MAQFELRDGLRADRLECTALLTGDPGWAGFRIRDDQSDTRKSACQLFADTRHESEGFFFSIDVRKDNELAVFEFCSQVCVVGRAKGLFVAEAGRQALRPALPDPERRCGRLKELARQTQEAGKGIIARDLTDGPCFDCLHLRSDRDPAADKAVIPIHRDISSIFQSQAYSEIR